MKGSVENSNFCTSGDPHHLPQKDKDMTTIKRFVLDHERNVIDTLNPTGPTGLLFDDEPEDEIYLREKILRECLFEPVDDLIINVQPEKTDSWGEPYNEEAHAIRRAILNAIRASQLNTLEPALSINNRFDGTLKRKKVGLQDVTSLSLFRDDVERILRDLYGDIDSEALERTLRSVWSVAVEFTRFVRKDLWREHQDAMDWDYGLGIGVPEGATINSHDWRRGRIAISDLGARVRKVRENPSAFSRYTVAFGRAYEERIVVADDDTVTPADEPVEFELPF
jgi:hypothetical protein